MKKWLRYLLIVLFVASATLGFLYYSKVTVTQKELDRYNSQLSEAEQYYQIKEYANAVHHYSLAADILQTKIDAYEGILTVLIEKNQLGQASDVVDNSIGKLSALDKARLYLMLGDAYYDEANMTRAEKYFLNSYKAKSNIDAIIGLAKTYIQVEDNSKAADYLNNVSGVDDSKTLEAALLKAYIKLDDISAALKYFNEVDSTLIEDEDVLNKYNSFVFVLNNVGDDELYKIALLSKEYVNAGFPTLAVQLLEPKKDDMTEYPDGLYVLGRAYFDKGDYASAVEVLDSSVSLGAYTGEIYQLLALSQKSLGDRTKTVDYYEKAIEFGEDEIKAGLIKEYVEFLFEEEVYSTAKTYLERYANNYDDGWASYGYVEMYYLQRDFEKMRYHLDVLKAIADKTDVEKKEYLKWEITYNLENDMMTKAKEQLNDLKSLDRFNPEYHLLLGRVALAEADADTAQSAFERAIDYDLQGDVTTSAKKLLDRIE